MNTAVALPKPRSKRGNSPTLGWYLALTWLNTILVTTFALAALIYLVDVVELMRRLSGTNIAVTTALSKSLLKLPDLMLQLLSIAVLLGSLLWLQQLNRRNELVAIRAAGLPARRLLMAPIIMCLLLSTVALTVGNPLAATMLKSYESWYGNVFPNVTKGLVTAGGSIWLRQREADNAGGRDYFIYGAKVTPNGASLGQASVFVFNAKGEFLARLDATQAELQEGRWLLNNVFLLSPRKEVAFEPQVILPTSLTPDQIQASFNPPGTLNVWELYHFIQVLHQSGFATNRHAMAFQRLLALPAMCLAMLLLAVPFGLRFQRVRNVALMLGLGLGLGAVFYLFGNYMAIFGLAGRLDVILAAWLPAGIACLLAVAMLLQLHEE